MGGLFCTKLQKFVVARKKHAALLCVMQVLMTQQQHYFCRICICFLLRKTTNKDKPFVYICTKKYVILSICEESHSLIKLIFKLNLCHRDSSGDKHPQNDFHFINYFLSTKRRTVSAFFCFNGLCLQNICLFHTNFCFFAFPFKFTIESCTCGFHIRTQEKHTYA